MELKFSSQVCTDINQSKKLLELGLKPETADMCYTTFHINGVACPMCYIKNEDSKFKSIDTPAWSLHRLLCMLDYDNADTFDIMPNLAYDDVLATIEGIINAAKFNKEYLNK